MKRYKAIITERAQQDVIRAKSYYDSLQPGLGNRFLKLFRDKIRAIREEPFAHAIRYHNVRFAHLDNFPYVIQYFIDEDDPLLVIITLHHERDNPERWLEYHT